MQIFRHYNDLPDDARGGVIAVGNFDGVHLGHQEVIATAGRMARGSGRPWGVLTFDPHPRVFLQPGVEPFQLTPLGLKAKIIESMGVDFLLVLRFDAAMARKSADDFVDEVIVGGLKANHVVAGMDFAFGHKRYGTATFLAAEGSALGFATTSVTQVRDAAGEVISSTRVRNLLTEARPRDAAQLLGRCHEIEGPVVHGEKRGRGMGFPTANIALDEMLLPAVGIYAVRAGLSGAPLETDWKDGVASIGYRPTFVDDAPPLLETYLFDFDGDLYGRTMRVALVDYIRPEAKFDGAEALAEAIAGDCARAKAILAAQPARGFAFRLQGG